MHASLPIIGTPVGGIKETISEDGERGFYWLGDLEDLRNKINICLSETEEKKLMAERAKKYVEEKLKMKITINQIYAK
jgi:glycosyltransferase involved in cell wall biosynthesis